MICPSYVIEHPERITVEEIHGEPNAELRRVKIERYGFDRYLRDAKLEEVQRDDFGVLYRRGLGKYEPPLTFVKVVNATPEPDGTRKEYVLPVRSTVRTAHEAVASTFGLTVEEYHPSFES